MENLSYVQQLVKELDTAIDSLKTRSRECLEAGVLEHSDYAYHVGKIHAAEGLSSLLANVLAATFPETSLAQLKR